MITEDKISEIFCIADDFCKEFDKEIEKNTVADWNNRDDIKAELKMNIIILLASAGYTPKIHDEVLKEILEQAENFKRHAPALGYSIDDYDDTISIAAEP